MGALDRALAFGCVFLIAWPDGWIRVAFAALVLAADVSLGMRDVTVRGHTLRAGERHVAAIFATVMAVHKLVAWALACVLLALLARYAVRKYVLRLDQNAHFPI